MNDKKRRRRDFIQNLSIALLAVSAALLFAKMYHPGGFADHLQLLSSPNMQVSGDSTSTLPVKSCSARSPTQCSAPKRFNACTALR